MIWGFKKIRWVEVDLGADLMLNWGYLMLNWVWMRKVMESWKLRGKRIGIE